MRAKGTAILAVAAAGLIGLTLTATPSYAQRGLRGAAFGGGGGWRGGGWGGGWRGGYAGGGWRGGYAGYGGGWRGGYGGWRVAAGVRGSLSGQPRSALASASPQLRAGDIPAMAMGVTAGTAGTLIPAITGTPRIPAACARCGGAARGAGSTTADLNRSQKRAIRTFSRQSGEGSSFLPRRRLSEFW